jgi:NTP pyrophosphatase (non-canonical NTP hydrolase)
MNPTEYQKACQRTETDQDKSRNRMLGFAGPRELFLFETGNEITYKSIIRLNHGSIGIVKEGGEILALLEKWIYYGKDLSSDIKDKVKDELGDVLWYCALVANSLGLDLGECMSANIAKLKVRYPDKFDPEKADESKRDRVAEAKAQSDPTPNIGCPTCGTGCRYETCERCKKDNLEGMKEEEEKKRKVLYERVAVDTWNASVSVSPELLGDTPRLMCEKCLGKGVFQDSLSGTMGLECSACKGLGYLPSEPKRDDKAKEQVCKKCNGTRMYCLENRVGAVAYKCDACTGIGVIGILTSVILQPPSVEEKKAEESVVCPDCCGGKGKYVSMGCGESWTVCKRCKGEGTLKIENLSVGDTIFCPGCKGSGFQNGHMCGNCEGRKRVKVVKEKPCPHCGGRGEVSDEWSTALTTCPVCDGKSTENEEQRDILVFVRWYSRTAVYWGGALTFYGDLSGSGNWNLLNAIGYKCSQLKEIPTHNIPPEFDRDENKRWKPPATLGELRKQFDAYNKRAREEKIASLKEELAQLLNPSLKV